MRTVFITFADRKLAPTLKIIKKEAIDSGFFDVVKVYDDRTFDKEYWKKYHTFYEQNSRGFGYWIWKPYIIKRELERISDGDVLVYLDAGCVINAFGGANYSRYLDYLNTKQDIICFEHQNCFAKQYNKMQLLQHFDLANNLSFLESRQLMAGLLLIKKTETSVDLVSEWYSIMHGTPNLIDDSPSDLPELPDFIAHRHDQSVFSALCYKYGIKGLPQQEVYPNGGDWSQMTEYPFWAARRKVFAKPSLIERIYRKLARLSRQGKNA